MNTQKLGNLEVWKRSARLSADIYRALKDLKDFGFRDQITRSGLSIPSNIAEGLERKSKKEFLVFLKYALGSCGELRTQTYIGMEIGYISNDYLPCQNQPSIPKGNKVICGLSSIFCGL